MLHPIDRDGQLPLDDVPHLLFRMVVLMYRDGVSVDLVVHEGHVVGVKETTVPTRQWLPGVQLTRVDESHDARISAAETCHSGCHRTSTPDVPGVVSIPYAVLAIALASVATAPSSAGSLTRP